MNDRVALELPEAPLPSQLVDVSTKTSAQKGTHGLKIYRLIAAGLALLITAVIAIGWWISDRRDAVQYTTAAVTRGAITRTVAATGTVNPELTIIVGTYVSGIIQEVYCDFNTIVKKGQVCAKIDPRPYQTVVEQNKANLAVAQAQLEKDQASLAYAKITYERHEQLVRTHSVSRVALDNAKSEYEQALAQIALNHATIRQRQAALDAAQVNHDYTDIISPVDGTVVSRNVTMGQTVAASFQTPTLFLIATDLTRMQVDSNVSESDIGGVKDGDRATLSVDAFPRRIFQGTVTQVRQSPQMVQNVVTYDVVITVGNSDLALKPGMTASTRIVIDQRNNVLRVPNQALRYVPNEFQASTPPDGLSSSEPTLSDEGRVFVLQDGRPVPVVVTRGLEDDTFTEIATDDIEANDLIIVSERAGTRSQSIIPAPF